MRGVVLQIDLSLWMINSKLIREEEATGLLGGTSNPKLQVQWSSKSEVQQCLTNLGYLSPSVTPVAPLNQSLSALSLRYTRYN